MMNLIPDNNQIKIISVDVFDTLIFRAVSQPKDLFLTVYEKASREGLIGKYIKSGDFQRFRMDEEKKFYQQGMCPTIEQIYKKLSEWVCKEPMRVLEIELETEREFCYRNDDVYEELLNAYNAGKKLYIVSDMYLSKRHMEKLLKACEIDTTIFSDILVSCDYGVSKKNGGLYDVLLSKCREKPNTICHVGDNYDSDVRSANERGLHSSYYPVKDFTDASLSMESLFNQNAVPEIMSMRKLISYKIAASNMPEDVKKLQIYGAEILAPFYTSATEWLIDVLEQEKIQKVFFLMREGALFKKLFDNAQKFRENKIEAELFYSSRNSLFLPGQKMIDENGMRCHLDGFKKEIVTVSGVFNLFAVEELYPDMLKGLEDVRIRDLPKEKYDFLNKYMTGDEILAAVNHKIELSKKNCLKYIRNMEIDSDSVAIVDLGYKGSAQTFLDGMCKNSHLNILYIGKSGCYEKICEGHRFAGYYSTCGHDEHYLDYVINAGAPFEALLMRGDGCSVSYDECGKPVQTPVKNIPERQFEAVKNIHDGIFKYQELFLNVSRRNEVIKETVKKSNDLFRILGRSFLYPTVDEVGLLAPVLNEENFGTEVARDVYLADIKDENELPKGTIEGKRFWKMGILVYNNPLYYIRSRYILNNQPDEIPLIDMVAEHKTLKRVVIVGAGLAGERMLTYCMACGIEVDCFMDNNPSKQGGRVCGLPVKAPGDSVGNIDAFLVASIKYKMQLTEQFKNLYGKDVF